ncbi:GNAT family N-acetyltransferase [Gangjinia marincola]|uniref:GNAT family N-acetyltransferase n=1 Tax=Gangjinia marincola TaxID=578463 RepID=A0ABN1MEV1_9FLAO
MVTLKNELVKLRALEPEDLEYLFSVENDEEFWEISHTNKPFSRKVLQQYLKNDHHDIYVVKQQRFVICSYQDDILGFIDLFDFNPKHKRAGVGILLVNKEDRGKGYGKQALTLVLNYCFERLDLHQVYANIAEDNHISRTLFKSCGFKEIGIKKDWNFHQGVYHNELIVQHIHHVS